MDRVIEARLAAVRTRIDQLSQQEQSLLARLQQVREQLEAARAEQTNVEAASQRALTGRRNVVAEEAWRRAVRELGTFTVRELATELGCSPITAKKHLYDMKDAGMVQPAGRLGRSPMYSYIKPDDAGEGFDAQRRLRSVETIGMTDRTYAGPVAGTGRSPADSINHPALRAVVRKGLSNGWRLHKRGDGHFAMVKPGCAPITVPSSPQNATEEAKSLTRKLRDADQLAA